MRIYVITAGSYSDYHICAVTDDSNSAKNLRLLYSSDYSEAMIEEYDTEKMSEPPKYYWNIGIDLNGELRHCNKEHYVGKPPEYLNYVEIVCSLYYNILVNGKDEKHALKNAFDKLAEFKYEHMEEVEKAEAENRSWKKRMEQHCFNMASATCFTGIPAFPDGEKL